MHVILINFFINNYFSLIAAILYLPNVIASNYCIFIIDSGQCA